MTYCEQIFPNPAAYNRHFTLFIALWVRNLGMASWDFPCGCTSRSSGTAVWMGRMLALGWELHWGCPSTDRLDLIVWPERVPKRWKADLGFWKSLWWQLRGWIKEGDRGQRDKVGGSSFWVPTLSTHWGFSEEQTKKNSCLCEVYILLGETQ